MDQQKLPTLSLSLSLSQNRKGGGFVVGCCLPQLSLRGFAQNAEKFDFSQFLLGMDRIDSPLLNVKGIGTPHFVSSLLHCLGPLVLTWLLTDSNDLL